MRTQNMNSTTNVDATQVNIKTNKEYRHRLDLQDPCLGMPCWSTCCRSGAVRLTDRFVFRSSPLSYTCRVNTDIRQDWNINTKQQTHQCKVLDPDKGKKPVAYRNF